MTIRILADVAFPRRYNKRNLELLNGYSAIVNVEEKIAPQRTLKRKYCHLLLLIQQCPL